MIKQWLIPPSIFLWIFVSLQLQVHAKPRPADDTTITFGAPKIQQNNDRERQSPGAGAVMRSNASIGTGDFGLGLYLGEPMAMTARYWMKNNLAIQAMLGISNRYDKVQVAGDAAHVFRNLLIQNSSVELTLALGGGVAFGGLDGRFCDRGGCHNHTVLVMLRGPMTFSVMLRQIPLEFFAEFVVGLELIPHADLRFLGGVGARYYFQ